MARWAFGLAQTSTFGEVVGSTHEVNTLGQYVLGAGGYAAGSVGNRLGGVPTQFSWAGVIASSVSSGITSELHLKNETQQSSGVSTGNFFADVAGGALSGGTNRELSRALGDDRVQSWAQIGERATGTALGNLVGPLLSTSTPGSQIGKDGSLSKYKASELGASSTYSGDLPPIDVSPVQIDIAPPDTRIYVDEIKPTVDPYNQLNGYNDGFNGLVPGNVGGMAAAPYGGPSAGAYSGMPLAGRSGGYVNYLDTPESQMPVGLAGGAGVALQIGVGQNDFYLGAESTYSLPAGVLADYGSLVAPGAGTAMPPMLYAVPSLLDPTQVSSSTLSAADILAADPNGPSPSLGDMTVDSPIIGGYMPSQAAFGLAGYYGMSSSEQSVAPGFRATPETFAQRVYEDARANADALTPADDAYFPGQSGLTRLYPQVLKSIGSAIGGITASDNGVTLESQNYVTRESMMGNDVKDARLNLAANAILVGVSSVEEGAMAIGGALRSAFRSSAETELPPMAIRLVDAEITPLALNEPAPVFDVSLGGQDGELISQVERDLPPGSVRAIGKDDLGEVAVERAAAVAGGRLAVPGLETYGDAVVVGVRGGVDDVIVPNNAEQIAIRARVEANVAQSAAARASSNFEIHALNEVAPSLDVSTPAGKAIIWSNSRGGNLTLADDFIAQNMGYLRLESTPGGQYLQSLKLFERYPYEQAIQPWERLSAQYATGASGEVTAFTSGASPTSVFQRIELPILSKNPNVTNIKYMIPPVRTQP